MSKQTAVEWLTEKIETQREKGEVDLRTILHYCNQAKAMEKEQIIDAYLTPLSNEYWFQKDEILNQESKKYYNETYGGDK
jgi:hypothetical protein